MVVWELFFTWLHKTPCFVVFLISCTRQILHNQYLKQNTINTKSNNNQNKVSFEKTKQTRPKNELKLTEYGARGFKMK